MSSADTFPSHAALPAAAFLASDDLPWVPSGTPGKSSKLLRILDGGRGFVELLRMEAGLAMPLHRHTGDVHVFQLEGHRLLGSGERIGPGDYVHEPAGNVDTWKVAGDAPMLALAIVHGEVEFIGPGGAVRSRADAATQHAEYVRHCEAHGLAVCALGG